MAGLTRSWNKTACGDYDVVLSMSIFTSSWVNAGPKPFVHNVFLEGCPAKMPCEAHSKPCSDM